MFILHLFSKQVFFTVQSIQSSVHLSFLIRAQSAKKIDDIFCMMFVILWLYGSVMLGGNTQFKSVLDIKEVMKVEIISEKSAKMKKWKHLRLQFFPGTQSCVACSSLCEHCYWCPAGWLLSASYLWLLCVYKRKSTERYTHQQWYTLNFTRRAEKWASCFPSLPWARFEISRNIFRCLDTYNTSGWRSIWGRNGQFE